MRQLMITFVEDGEIFSEIDEDRNYFLTEAEQVVEKIKVRLKNEKRVASPKEFECWIDGKRLVITHVRFENDDSLEEQLKETIMSAEWEEETKHKYVNKINEYVETERELMTNRVFKVFMERFDQYMGSPDIRPFPLLLSIERLKELFDGIVIHVDAGFYSEMEEIMRSIYEAYGIVIKNIEKELFEVGNEEYEGSFEEFVQVRTLTWLGNKDNFVRFKNYVVSHHKSVKKSRIGSLYPRFKGYQQLQKMLFVEHTQVLGFDTAYGIHKRLLEGFYDKYDDTLFEGFALDDDDLITNIILNTVVMEVRKEIQAMLPKEEVLEEKDEDEGEEVDEKEGSDIGAEV